MAEKKQGTIFFSYYRRKWGGWQGGRKAFCCMICKNSQGPASSTARKPCAAAFLAGYPAGAAGRRPGARAAGFQAARPAGLPARRRLGSASSAPHNRLHRSVFEAVAAVQAVLRLDCIGLARRDAALRAVGRAAPAADAGIGDAVALRRGRSAGSSLYSGYSPAPAPGRRPAARGRNPFRGR